MKRDETEVKHTAGKTLFDLFSFSNRTVFFLFFGLNEIPVPFEGL